VNCSNVVTSVLFALLPLIANRRELQSLWASLDVEIVSIVTVTVATLFVAHATFSWTFSPIPFLFWNHMQNSRRLHSSLLDFAAHVSSAETLDPDHLMSEFKLWSMRHGQLLDARCSLDKTYNGPLGLLLFVVLGLASTLNVLIFFDKSGFDNLRTMCVRLHCLCFMNLNLLTIAAG
jgi:hypothetical protein